MMKQLWPMIAIGGFLFAQLAWLKSDTATVPLCVGMALSLFTLAAGAACFDYGFRGKVRTERQRLTEAILMTLQDLTDAIARNTAAVDAAVAAIQAGTANPAAIQAAVQAINASTQKLTDAVATAQAAAQV